MSASNLSPSNVSATPPMATEVGIPTSAPNAGGGRVSVPKPAKARPADKLSAPLPWGHRLRRLLFSIQKRKVELGAKIQNQAFYCNALSGTSTYNISINSDMTVSCNCSDFDDTGHLGNLSEQTLPEVFHGPIATGYREKLAAGKLPLLKCLRCSDLRTARREEAEKYRTEYDLPRQGIMLENTILCNLECTACTNPITAALRGKKLITLEDVKLVSRMIREHRITRLAYFKAGEPYLSPRIKQELAILREENPDLVIWLSTNGMLVNDDRKREASMLLDEAVFSIDGIDEPSLTKYQVGGSFAKAFQNMVDLVKYRNARGKKTPTVEWKYVLFNWNDKPHMIHTAIDLARKAGVDSLSFWPTTRPLTGISWRWYLGRFFNHIGEPSWKGREMFFNKPAQCGSRPPVQAPASEPQVS